MPGVSEKGLDASVEARLNGGPMSRRILTSAAILAFCAGATACGRGAPVASGQAEPRPSACDTDPGRLETQTLAAAEEAESAVTESGSVGGVAAAREEDEEASFDESVDTDSAVSAAPAAPGAPAAAAPIRAYDRTRSDGPAQCVVTEETFAADFARDIRALDVRFGELPTAELANCTLACDLAEQICGLKDRICDLKALNPARSIADRCADAETRCAHAKDAASRRCGCDER